ncbi:extracellular matrix binding protein [Streptococcus pyogenes]|uniref:LPXTG cell wall anchor domain-containing protein n=1 Tax=Streptococcus pyogenes TaxID=1314 RepID=UPI0010F098A1|nr:DUF1542 domain-containing protein [Streptococcus pyogenes]VGS21973.1 extracellular matrix binding protein [Streptococcus pyogenes]VGS41387.1 extracellular matrix binding protein [Streptococcus pyogenes]VGS54868.1 extracellular matrix binding protein [Streptococcus pyogenes]VGS56685.1 extracellular matrix binding protein [Streptococcus pyogenes]VGS59743.1 extracellular matrix binding protein [Streptococcus pyogenes]
MFLKHQDVKQKNWRMRKVKKLFVSSCMLLTVGLGVAVPTAFSQSNGVMVVKAAEVPTVEQPENLVEFSYKVIGDRTGGRFHSPTMDFKFPNFFWVNVDKAKKSEEFLYRQTGSRGEIVVRDSALRVHNNQVDLKFYTKISNPKRETPANTTLGYSINSKDLKKDHKYSITFNSSTDNKAIVTSFSIINKFEKIGSGNGFNAKEVEKSLADNVEYYDKNVKDDITTFKDRFNGNKEVQFIAKKDGPVAFLVMAGIREKINVDSVAHFSNFKFSDITEPAKYKNNTGEAYVGEKMVSLELEPVDRRQDLTGEEVRLYKGNLEVGSGILEKNNKVDITLKDGIEKTLTSSDKLIVKVIQKESRIIRERGFIQVKENPKRGPLQQLEEAKRIALDKIKNNKWLDSTESTQEQSKVEEEYKLGVEALRQASGDQISALADQHSKRITSSASEPNIKKEEKLQNSKKKINQKLNEEQQRLSKDNTLLQKDKGLKGKELEEQAIKADKSLQSANSLEELKQKEQEGVNSIKYTPGLDIEIQKSAAIDNLKESYENLKSKIDLDKGLSSEEKENQKKLANEKLEEAISDIKNSAIDNADKIAETTEKGKEKIQNQYHKGEDIEKQKQDFLEGELSQAKNAELFDIQNDNSLTSQEKKTEANKVNQKFEEAKLSLQKVVDKEGLIASKDKLISGIQNVHNKGDIAKVRESYISSLKAVHDKTVDDIAKDPWLTKEQKTEQKNKAKEAFDNAEKNIKELTTADDIVQATSKHKGEIEASHTKGVKEDVLKAAIDEIDEKLNEVKEQIQKDPTVSREDKEAKVKEATDKANIAKEEIAKQSNADDVKKVTSEEKPKVTYTKGTLLKDQLEKALKELEDQKEATDKEISEDSTLSAEQKATQKQETQKRLDEAKAKLQLLKPDVEGDNALTADNINAIVKEGKPSIQKEYKKDDKTFEEHKKDFEAEVEKAKQAELDEVSNDKSMTTPEKEIAKAKVEEKAAEVLKSIDGVTSREMLDEKRPMISEIRDIHTDGNIDTVKDNAKAELQKVYDQTVAKINGDDTLDKATKEAQVKEADKALEAGKEVITKADDADKVGAAVTEHTPKIKAAHKTGDLKKVQEEANQALDKAAEKERGEINNDITLTAKDKEQQLKEVETALTKAKAKVAEAKTADAINDARDKGVATIDAVHKAGQDLGARKSGQVAKLEEAAKATKDKISADPTLTSKEKEEQSKAVDAELKKAIEAVNAADTADKVDDALGKGVTDIKNQHKTGDPVEARREAHSKELDRVAQETKGAIEKDPTLTTEEKAKQVKDVDAAKERGMAKLTEAKDADELDKAYGEGVTDIKNQHKSGDPVEARRGLHNKSIDEVAQATKDAITADTTLTEAEKETQRGNVDKEATKVKEELAKAKDADALDKAYGDGVTSIKNQHKSGDPIEARRGLHNKSIDEVAQATKDAITADTTLTEAEKETQRGNVDKEATKAKEELAKAKDADALDKAYGDGVTSIKNQHKSGKGLDVRKDEHKKALEAVAKRVTAEIEADPTLTPEVREQQKAEVQKELELATDKIAEAKDADEADKAYGDGVTAIENAHVIGKGIEARKDLAKKDLAEAVAKTKALIIEDKTLTDDQRKEQLSGVDTEYAKGIENIAAAKDAAGVDKAYSDGVRDILAQYKEGQNLDDRRNAAKEFLLKEADKVTKLINDDPTLTHDQKVDQINKVEQAKLDAIKSVDDAQTADDINDALGKGIENINNQYQHGDGVDVRKATAKGDLEKEAAKVKALIAKNPTLTQADKDKQTAAVDAAKNTAIAAVDDAQTAEGINQELGKGITAINKAYRPGEGVKARKEAAKADLEKEAAKVREAIANDPTLTKADKAKQTEAVAKALKAAIAAVDKATTAEGINQELGKGITAINKAYRPGEGVKARKEAAKADLEKEAAKVREAIANDPTLTKADKAKQTEAVAKALKAAIAAVDKATTADGVNQELGKGITAINKAYRPGEGVKARKEAAKANLEKVAKETKALISGDRYLSETEKAVQKQAVEQALAKALGQVEAAKTVEAVKLAENLGTVAIRSAYVAGLAKDTDQATAALNEAKQAAIEALKQAAAETLAKITTDAKLTEAQKAEQSENVSLALKTAIATVRSAQSIASVKEAKDKGITAIRAAYVPNKAVAKSSSANHLPKSGDANSIVLVGLGVMSLLLGMVLYSKKKESKD